MRTLISLTPQSPHKLHPQHLRGPKLCGKRFIPRRLRVLKEEEEEREKKTCLRTLVNAGSGLTGRLTFGGYGPDCYADVPPGDELLPEHLATAQPAFDTKALAPHRKLDPVICNVKLFKSTRGACESVPSQHLPCSCPPCFSPCCQGGTATLINAHHVDQLFLCIQGRVRWNHSLFA